jgi:hypothetical protein
MYGVDQHLRTPKHKENLKRDSKLHQQTLPQSFSKDSNQQDFSYQLCNAFVAANIPFRKLDNPVLTKFLKDQCSKPIPSERTIRKHYLSKIHDVFSKIKNIIGDNYIWFTVAETTDKCGRFIANLLIGVLNEETLEKPYLNSTKELEKTNHKTIVTFVQDRLSRFFLPNIVPINYSTPYMGKAGKSLNALYRNFIHCTCLAHGFARVVETLRIQGFRERFSNLPLPPESIVTR